MNRRLLSALICSFLALIMVSCTKVGTTTSTATGGGRNPWTLPGHLRIAGVSEPDNMNTLLGEQQIEVDLSMFWGGYLFNWNDENEFEPELATEVPTTKNGDISKDGLAITYHLRKGVHWQDGPLFNADDVIFTWHAVMNPRNNVQTRQGYELITAIDKKDEYTIVVHLKERYSPFIASFFSMSSTPYAILPKHLLAQYSDLNHVPYNTKPVGTGPFIVQEWRKGEVIRMLANPHYWRGAPKLQEVDYKIIPDETTILTQLRTHEADMEYNAPASQTPSYGSITGINIYKTPFTQYRMIAMNMSNPILADVRVRQALSYAVDQPELINTVSHGVNMKGDSDQPPFLWAHADGLKQYAHDAQQAGALLDQAGWKLGPDKLRYKNGQLLSLEMSGATGSAETRNMEAIVQRQWREVGVQGIVKNYNTAIFFANYGAGGILQTGKFDTGFYSWLNGVDPDDATLFMCNQFPPKGQNNFHFCSHDLDAAERVALTEYDQDKRKAAYDRVQHILADQQPIAIVWFVRRQDIVNSDLKGYKPAHAVTAFWNTWEWQL